MMEVNFKKKFEGEISNIDDSFRSYKFKYSLIEKNIDNESGEVDTVSLSEEGTIESIAMRIRKIFRDFHGR